MKTLVAVAVTLAASTAAHAAELLVPKGTTGTLKVEYAYTSGGREGTAAIGNIDTWDVRRVVTITAQYTADAPQPFGPMHSGDSKQQAQMNDLQARATSTQAKLQPTANDMMKIVQECGDSEECIGKKVSAYANSMQVTPDMKSAGADIAAMSKAGGPRFQMWRLTSQGGSYRVDETLSKQVFEMTCTATKVCLRTVTRKGGDEIPAPPGGRSVAGSSMLEVDSTGRDIVLTLPIPLAPLTVKKTVTSSIAGDTNASGPDVVQPWMLPAAKAMTVTIPNDLRGVSGRKDFPITGRQSEGGVLTVSWQFTRN